MTAREIERPLRRSPSTWLMGLGLALLLVAGMAGVVAPDGSTGQLSGTDIARRSRAVQPAATPEERRERRQERREARAEDRQEAIEDREEEREEAREDREEDREEDEDPYDG